MAAVVLPEPAEISGTNSQVKTLCTVTRWESGDIEPSTPPWDRLPPEILTLVFSFLNTEDKNNVEGLCSTWKTACNVPLLWRNQLFYFNGTDPMGLVDRGCRSIERRGHLLRHVTLKIGFPSLPQAWVMSQCVHKLLSFMGAHPSTRNIESVRVTKLNFFSHWRLFTLSKRTILQALSDFLRSQRGLRVVDFTSCRLSANDGMRILRALRISSRHSVQRLDLHEFFQRKYYATSGHRLTNLITSSFGSLRELGLDAQHLDSGFLQTITETSLCRCALRKLRLYFERLRHPRAVIPDKDWLRARRACPQLDVVFSFCGWFTFPEARQMLAPSIPLTECVITWPRSYRLQFDKNRDLAETIDYVTHLYSGIMQCFSLLSDIKTSPDLENSLLRAATLCRQLTSFKVTLKLNPGAVNEIKEILSQRVCPRVCVWLVPRKSTQVRLHRVRPRGTT